MPSLEDFSSGYYTTEMVITPYEDGPAIEQSFHHKLRTEYYEQTDAPVLFRLGLNGEPYFGVESEFSIPDGIIGIPESWLLEQNMDGAYEDTRIYILKPSHAHLLAQTKTLRQEPSDVEG